MAEIKGTAETAAKWARRAGSAGPEYEEGVRNPRRDWATETKNAEKNYEAGVTAAIQRKSFGKGVSRVGTSGWQTAALEKGPVRYATGVQGAASKYAEGYDPYRQVIAGLKLPDRAPKGDPRNIERVSVIANALHAKKLSLA